MSVNVGDIVEGVVTGITKFGAFVLLPTGTTGLVHISEVANTYVKDINDVLKKNDKVKVKVLSVEGSGRVALSIKQTEAPPPPRYQAPKIKKGKPDASFEDKISRYLKESDERQHDIKKNTDSKRGGKAFRP